MIGNSGQIKIQGFAYLCPSRVQFLMICWSSFSHPWGKAILNFSKKKKSFRWTLTLTAQGVCHKLFYSERSENVSFLSPEPVVSWSRGLGKRFCRAFFGLEWAALLWGHAKKIHASIGGWGGLVESGGRTKKGIEEEIAAANSNLQVKEAPTHPVSSIRGGSAPK